MKTTVKITKEELISILQDIRRNMSDIGIPNKHYKLGKDVQQIENAYFNTIRVSGETCNRIDQSRMLIVKYKNTNNEICSCNISILQVWKHAPKLIIP